MARIRSVHPGLWTDDEFVALSLHARLFLIGLWNEADDYGLFAWKPLRLKMRLAPADAIDAGAIMAELVEGGFLVRIERDGKPLGVVRNFRKFQRPKNPSAPMVPVDEEIRAVIDLPEGDMPTPVLPQGLPRPSENRPQMEDGGDKREEGREEEETGNTDPEPARRVAPDGYAFEGTVVRLTHADFAKWRSAYTHLELAAELTARDAYLAGPEVTPRDRKNWFQSTSKYLANRNSEAAQRARAGPRLATAI